MMTWIFFRTELRGLEDTQAAIRGRILIEIGKNHEKKCRLKKQGLSRLDELLFYRFLVTLPFLFLKE